jgi:hypothetical protein
VIVWRVWLLDADQQLPLQHLELATYRESWSESSSFVAARHSLARSRQAHGQVLASLRALLHFACHAPSISAASVFMLFVSLHLAISALGRPLYTFSSYRSIFTCLLRSWVTPSGPIGSNQLHLLSTATSRHHRPD